MAPKFEGSDLWRNVPEDIDAAVPHHVPFAQSCVGAPLMGPMEIVAVKPGPSNLYPDSVRCTDTEVFALTEQALNQYAAFLEITKLTAVMPACVTEDQVPPPMDLPLSLTMFEPV